MQLGRIPAQSVGNLRGENNILSGIESQTDADIMHHSGECQQPILGNRCGHVSVLPQTPTFPANHKKRFPVLELAKARLMEAYFYPLMFAIGCLFFHKDSANKDGSYRQRRSESREMLMCLLGTAIAHTVNIASMAIGKILPNGTFSPYGVKYLASVCNTTEQRVLRALTVFQDAGYITLVERKYMLPNGEYRSETPIITVSPSFFIDLGIDEEYLKHHQKKQETKEKKEALVEKSKEYNQQQRANQKAAKKAMKNIREVLEKAKKGNSGSGWSVRQTNY